MKHYESVYVTSGKRDDGTFGINRCADFIVVYSSKRDAEEARTGEDIVLDIGAVVDKTLIKDGTISLTEIRKRAKQE